MPFKIEFLVQDLNQSKLKKSTIEAIAFASKPIALHEIIG